MHRFFNLIQACSPLLGRIKDFSASLKFWLYNRKKKLNRHIKRSSLSISLITVIPTTIWVNITVFYRPFSWKDGHQLRAPVLLEEGSRTDTKIYSIFVEEWQKIWLRPLLRKNYKVKIKIIIKFFLTDWAVVGEPENCRNELISTPFVSVPAASVPVTGPSQNLEQPPSHFPLVLHFSWILTECNIWLQQSVFSF